MVLNQTITKPNIINVTTTLISTTQNSHQLICVATLGHRAKLVNKILIWLTNTAIANAVVVVNG